MYSVACCLVLGQIKSSFLRKLWSTTTGFAIGFFFYGYLWVLNIGFVLVNYLLMRCLPRSLGSNAMVWFSALSCMSASFYHFHMRDANEAQWDIDLIFMMNFIKIHMMATNYDNASKLDDPVASKDFTERERKFAEPLRNRVHFIDFCNYMFFVASSWTGMAHEYKHFDDWVNEKEGFKDIPRSKLFAPAFSRFGQMLLCVVLKVLLNSNFPIKFLLTSEWAALNFFHRFGYLIAAINNNVITCFVGFSAMETVMIACG